MSDEDELPEVDELFIGLTQPPLMAGIPITAFGFLFMGFGVGFILADSFLAKALFALFVLGPIYLVFRVLTQMDVNWMNVIITTFQKCGPTLNKNFWKSNSYMP